MEFKKFIQENIEKKDIEKKNKINETSIFDNSQQDLDSFTKEEIIEMIMILDYDELQEIGEDLMEIIYDEDDDDDDDDDVDEALNEKKYFAKKNSQVKRDKKLDKSAKRKLAKKRKQVYKRNKSKVKRKQKLYRKKAKRQPNQVRRHKK